MKRKTVNFTYGMITNKGGRVINEDFCDIYMDSNRFVCLLCDGLGGHGNGEVASSLVVNTMKQSLQQQKTVEDSIITAQHELLRKQKEEHRENSMKTTLACLEISNNQARFVHVGDSRVYWFEKGKYKKRTTDHSVPQMLFNTGAIKENDIRHHEDRSRLLRVMGTVWDSPKYQITSNIAITNKSSFLLCSDGFWELIDEKMMEKTLKKAQSPAEWLGLMETVVRKNGQGTNMDNYTAIAIYIR